MGIAIFVNEDYCFIDVGFSVFFVGVVILLFNTDKSEPVTKREDYLFNTRIIKDHFVEP